MQARVAVAVALAALGCTTTREAIRPDHDLVPGAAYLYGRFFIRSDDPGTWAGHQSIGLTMGCTDGYTYTIWFSTTRDIQVIQARPSWCALTSVTRTDENGLPMKKSEVAREDMRMFNFAPGRAYYLGDLFGRGVSSLTIHSTFYEHYWSWAWDAADDRINETTAEFKRVYPKLASLPVMDARIVPKKPAPPPHRGIVIDDAKEPPMTPERIARVAPFIKRTFPSPAACEAACKTGECLPFRGDGGSVAMTCIVRCNTGHDCSDGLACNCPNDQTPDGPDCHPIASTPGDRMARICLSPPPAQ